MKLKKKEDKNVDTSFILRMGNKVPMEGVTVTKFRPEMEKWTIQRQPQLGNQEHKAPQMAKIVLQ